VISLLRKIFSRLRRRSAKRREDASIYPMF
jgi:hypothetical protein